MTHRDAARLTFLTPGNESPRKRARAPRGSLTPAPRRRGPRRPQRRPHLPGEAAARLGAERGQPRPGRLASPAGPAAGAGTRGRRFPPGAAKPARGLARGPPGLPRTRACWPRRAAAPHPGPRSLPAAGATAPAPAPRPAAARAGGFTHLAPPPRLPHVTARPRGPRHQQRGHGRTPGDPARPPPPPPGSSPGRRQ